MQNRISYIGIVGIIVGAVMLISVADLPNLSALFPRTVAWALIVIGSGETVRNFVVGMRHSQKLEQTNADDSALDSTGSSSAESSKSTAGGQVKPVLIFAATTIVYVALIPVIGFYVMTAVFLIGLMLALGIRKPLLYLGIPIIVIAVIYLAFTMQLKVPLPEGVLL